MAVTAAPPPRTQESLALEVRAQEPAVLIKLLRRGNHEILADFVDFLEATYRDIDVLSSCINLRDHLANRVVCAEEPFAELRRAGVGCHLADAGIEGPAKRNDPLCKLISNIASVHDKLIKKLMEPQEIRTPHMPVGLLTIDGERDKITNDRLKIACHLCRSVQVIDGIWSNFSVVAHGEPP